MPFHLYGLIGYPLSHSFSKRYFSEKFAREGILDHAYELFPIERIDLLPSLLAEHPDLKGLNVTIPYKQAVIPFLDEVEEEAAAVGAVNTIRIREGRLTGFNTDVYGFEVSLRHFLEEAGNPSVSALVLGTGGAARAVTFVLDKMDINYRMVSRNPAKGDLRYQDIDAAVSDRYRLIINTTPLGMAPNLDSFPILPYDNMTSGHLLYDLVYNPEKTVFLAKGALRKTHIKNGLEMLHLQAERAWEIWNG